MTKLEKMIKEELKNARENGYYLDGDPREIALDLMECTGEYEEYSIFELEKAVKNVQTKSNNR